MELEAACALFTQVDLGICFIPNTSTDKLSYYKRTLFLQKGHGFDWGHTYSPFNALKKLQAQYNEPNE